MRDTGYLVWRAALAITLMVAFYGLALASAAALVAIPVLLLRYSIGAGVKVGLFTVAGAFIILKSILPRRDVFEPPGPRLDRKSQPRLFAEIGRIAVATRQAEPAEVYLVPDVNAWVGQRGGLMGVGSRRVMGLGLPLLQALRVDELRAVLAHEFGHFDGGDVALGPWIHSTRGALLRTLEDLHEHSAVLTAPFAWFADLFFRATHAVSRHQELLADQLAVRVGGLPALVSGLRAVDRASLAFGPYWTALVDPILSAGFLPPLAAGFDTFLEAPWLPEALKAHAATPAEPSPFDTHPPLHVRLAALGVADSARPPRSVGPLALSLLDGVPDLERRLGAVLTRRGPGSTTTTTTSRLGLERSPPELTPLPWGEVGAKVWLPDWERMAHEARRHLEGVTPASLPGLDWQRLGRRLVAGHSNAEPLPAADTVVGAAVAVALARAGFTIDSTPGLNVTLAGPGGRVEPFGLRTQLASGPDAPRRWLDLCADAGIADIDLGSIGRTPRR